MLKLQKTVTYFSLFKKFEDPNLKQTSHEGFKEKMPSYK
jgi:hypothetical protein